MLTLQSQCPDHPNCSHSYPHQGPLSIGQYKLLTGPAASQARSVLRCSHCGLVYLPRFMTQPPTKFGFLNKDIVGDGWHPLQDRS
jgi:hypothetical protein